jgi:hypothetical protein
MPTFKNLPTLARLVAHACNPSYSGGRDQKDHGSKPAQANSSMRPYLQKKIQNRAGGVAQDVGPEFKPQYCKKKKIFQPLNVHELAPVVTKRLCCHPTPCSGAFLKCHMHTDNLGSDVVWSKLCLALPCFY